MATMSYVADVSSAGGRTTRVMVLEAMTFLGGTVGPLIAGALMPVAGREAVFALILASHLFVIAYVIFVLPQVR
jgi:MFS family permease